MKKYYIAAFVPEEDGSGYSVYFPDVPRCFTGGETLEEAVARELSEETGYRLRDDIIWAE